MKKLYCLLSISLLLLTGCSKKYTCTIKEDSNGIHKEEILNIKFNKQEVTNVGQKMVMTLSQDYENVFNTTYDAIKSEYRKYKKLDGYTLKTGTKDNQIIIDLKINLKKTETRNIHLFDTSLKEDALLEELKSKGYVCE